MRRLVDGISSWAILRLSRRRMAGYRLENHIVSESRGVSSFRMVLVGQLAGENRCKYWLCRVQIVEAARKKVETMTSIACACPNTNQKSCHVSPFLHARGGLTLFHLPVSPASPVILKRSWISWQRVTRENDLYTTISTQALLEIQCPFCSVCNAVRVLLGK